MLAVVSRELHFGYTDAVLDMELDRLYRFYEFAKELAKQPVCPLIK